jgi:predicted metal-binding protein
MITFEVETPSKRKIKIEVYSEFIPKAEIKTNRTCFLELCKKCRNYGKKYACPPASPDFNLLCNKEGLYGVMLKCNLNQIKNTGEYNKIRIANSIMKSRIDKFMRRLEEKSGNKLKFLSSGSCRLCKKCNLEKNLPCKYPTKMRFSLEATGIHVEDLTKKLFNLPLLWYDSKKHKAPKYTCVVAGMMCNKIDVNKIKCYSVGITL